MKHSLQLCAIAAVLVGSSLAVLYYKVMSSNSNNDNNNNNLKEQQQQQQQQTPNLAMGQPSSLRDAFYNTHGGAIAADAVGASSTPTIPISIPPPSPYTHAQYFGFQIYTGGAPAFVRQEDGSAWVDDTAKSTTSTSSNSSSSTSTTATTKSTTQQWIPNPECHHMPYGEVVLEEDPLLQCYLGHGNATKDVAQRLQIMRDAVEAAHAHADASSTTLKIFVAPEFYWRGRHQGAYELVSLDKVFSDKCSGPICAILRGLEDIVEDQRYEHWFFVFGTIIATQQQKQQGSIVPTKPPGQEYYEHLFYNFAPIYKGFDPNNNNHDTTTGVFDPKKPLGKRFLLPKRYVSDSDFLRQVNLEKNVDFKEGWSELLGSPQNQPFQNDPLYQPHLRYDDHLFDEYKAALEDDAYYKMVEYDWLVMDGVTMTLEICFDHLKKTALNTYLGDMIQGRIARIPSSSSCNANATTTLSMVPIPIHQAQIGIVSSAGMSINANSMALVENGTLFLQDGMTNATADQYIDHEMWMTCDQAVQFHGGTEAVQRRSVVTKTDVTFLYTVLPSTTKVPVYNDDNDDMWKEKLQKVFTTAQYAPHVVVHDPVTLHFPNYHPATAAAAAMASTASP